MALPTDTLSGPLSGALAPTAPGKRDKLAYRLARQIAADIIRDGWVENRLLGQEKDLLAHYQVSRDPFREAVRILEWQGIATSVRGPNGGLRVAAPAADAVINILRDYLELTDISFDEVIEASRVICGQAIKLATPLLTDAHIERLQWLLGQSKFPVSSRQQAIARVFDLFTELGHLSGNLAVAVFMGPLNYILIDSSYLPQFSDAEFTEGSRRAWGSLRNIMKAMISGDDALAQHHMHHYYDVADRELNPRLHPPAATADPYPNPLWRENRDSKSALSLVYRIRHDIRRQGLQPGDRLGQEALLVEQYGVSRSIFREAVRMLELVGLAEHRMGRDGGLVVAQPNPDYTQSTAALFLGHADYNLVNLNPLHAHMESFVARRAAENITAGQAQQLGALIRAEASADPAGLVRCMTDVHRLIASIAGNRIFSLYLEVLFVLNRLNPLDNASATARDHASEFRHSHQRLADAIVARDPSLASRRMLDHFKLLARVVG